MVYFTLRLRATLAARGIDVEAPGQILAYFFETNDPQQQSEPAEAQASAHGRPNLDWMLEDGVVAPVRLLYPGGEHERMWVEKVVAVTPDGVRPRLSWGFLPLAGR